MIDHPPYPPAQQSVHERFILSMREARRANGMQCSTQDLLGRPLGLYVSNARAANVCQLGAAVHRALQVSGQPLLTPRPSQVGVDGLARALLQYALRHTRRWQSREGQASGEG